MKFLNFLRSIEKQVGKNLKSIYITKLYFQNYSIVF